MVIPCKMGTVDRDYSRREDKTGFLTQLPPVVRGLLITNVVIFLVDALLFNGGLDNLFGFQMESAVFQGHVWEFLTFQFLHFGVAHILMNSVGLYFFGPLLERAWGSSKFLIYYLLCGVGGALFFTLLCLLQIIPGGTLVGASAGIYGVLVGIAVLNPHQKVSLLFPPVTLTMKQLVLCVMGIAVVSILFRWGGNTGGEAGHLGGILAGFLLAKNPVLLSWADIRNRQVKIVRPKAFKRKSEAKLRPRTEVNLRSDSEVDRILDKISRDGFQSLTAEEKETLRKASETHQSKP